MASASPIVASAQQPPGARDAEARGLFSAGQAAFNDGRFEDALRYFQDSYRLSQRPLLLYNVATAADRLRQDAVALDAFERYLAALPAAENRAEVEARIGVLRAAVERDRAASATSQTHAGTPPPDDGAHANVNLTVSPDDADEDSTDAGAPVRDESSGGLLTRWWFWTAIGAVVVGAVIATVLIATAKDDTAALRGGDIGGTIFTLEAP